MSSFNQRSCIYIHVYVVLFYQVRAKYFMLYILNIIVRFWVQNGCQISSDLGIKVYHFSCKISFLGLKRISIVVYSLFVLEMYLILERHNLWTDNLFTFPPSLYIASTSTQPSTALWKIHSLYKWRTCIHVFALSLLSCTMRVSTSCMNGILFTFAATTTLYFM